VKLLQMLHTLRNRISREHVLHLRKSQESLGDYFKRTNDEYSRMNNPQWRAKHHTGV